MFYRNFYSLALALVLYGLIFPERAQAYLDAGTGSYLIQLVIAFIAGGLFVFKVFWRKIWFFFKRNKKSTVVPISQNSEEKSKTSQPE